MPGRFIANLAQVVNPVAVWGTGVLASVVVPFLFGLSAAEIGSYIGAVISSAAVIAGAALYWYQKAKKALREEKAEDERQRVEQFKNWEAARKETLAPQLERLNAQLQENKESTDRLRSNLHEARNEANQHATVAQGLRQDLQNANTANFALMQEVAKAQGKTSELMDKLGELTAQLMAENAENVRLRLQVEKLEPLHDEVKELSRHVAENKGLLQAAAPTPSAAGGIAP